MFPVHILYLLIITIVHTCRKYVVVFQHVQAINQYLTQQKSDFQV